MSPLLFALYVNDLHEFLLKAFDGLHTVNKWIEEVNRTDDTVIYFEIICFIICR